MYFLILTIPLLTTIIVSLFGRILGREGTYRLSIISLIIVTGFSIIGIYEAGIENITTRIVIGEWISSEDLNIRYGFIYDPLSLGMCFTIAFISLVVFIFSKDYLSEDPYIIRYYMNLSWFVLFMIILVLSENMLLTFMSWEGVGITSYLLINYWYTRRDSNLSAMQAVLLNRVGDWGFLIAIFFINLLYSGSLDYNILSIIGEYSTQPVNYIAIINLMILIAGIAKSAQMILHTWLPSAMAAPTPISSLLHAATMVTLGVYILIRGGVLLNGISNILLIIYFIGALTSLIASLTGFSQFDMKKVIAYSTSSQIGYMITACGSQEYPLAFNHLVNHAFFKAFLFINAGSIIHHLKDEQDFRNIGVLIKSNPWLHFAYLLGTLSLIAMPYFSGFYSKDLILEDLAHSWTISISGRIVYYLQLLTACITTIYCFRSYWFLFISDTGKSLNVFKNIHEYRVWPSIILSIPTLIAGYLLSDLLVGPGTGYWDGNGLTRLTENEQEEDEILVMTLLICFIGISLGYIFTVSPHILGKLNLMNIGGNRFYFDHIYNNLVAAPLLNEAKYTGAMLDKGLIEQLGYKGLSRIYIENKWSPNLNDSGFLPNTILLIFAGLLLFSTPIIFG